MKLFPGLRLAAAVICLLFMTACETETTSPRDVMARVNGVNITADQLEEAYLANIQGVDPLPDDEEADDLKFQLLNDIVTNEIMMQLAEERELTATDAEVEVRFNESKILVNNVSFASCFDGS